MHYDGEPVSYVSNRVWRKCPFCGEFFKGRHNSKCCLSCWGYYATARDQRSRAERLGLKDHFTAPEWRDLLVSAGFKCLSCGKESRALISDHIIPLSLGGPNTIGNIQPLCFSCNVSKRNRIVDVS